MIEITNNWWYFLKPSAVAKTITIEIHHFVAGLTTGRWIDYTPFKDSVYLIKNKIISKLPT